jgi:hypothetical protein
VVLASLALSLFVAFRQWRGRHEELAAYGRERVAPVILPLGRHVPRGIDAARWQRVVESMRDVLAALTGSAVLDLKEMQELRREIQLRVDRATRATAAHELESLWEELEARAGPVLITHPTIGLASTVRSLVPKAQGENVEAGLLMLLETRAMLLAVGQSAGLTKSEKSRLREAIDARLKRASPTNPTAALRDVWEIVDSGFEIPPAFRAARP